MMRSKQRRKTIILRAEQRDESKSLALAVVRRDWGSRPHLNRGEGESEAVKARKLCMGA